ncbi:MAG: extracellular solute-binding protein [Chloroflexi bacterium]|nr:extracellular solute-binding protein [Chloroflexota bacterium]
MSHMTTRRHLLSLTIGAAAAGLLSACAAGSTAKPAAAPTTPPAAAPTTASGAQPTTAAAAPQPTAAAAAAPTTPAQAAPAAGGQKVSIEYWQYFYQSKQDLINSLIQDFQKQNPNIEIVHNSTIPYEQFQEKLAAAAPAGQGPDVVNLYYGWLGKYTQSGYLQELPIDAFPPATLEKDFFPVVQGAKLQGKYWGIPTAVRTLAMFYNKDLLSGAGLDPNKPPATWEEFVDTAVKTTKRGSDGTLETAGFAWGPDGQGHQWWREALNRQNGLLPMSQDLKKLNWTDPKGVEAFTWWTDLVTKYKVGEQGFYTDDQTSFKTGHAALHIDGSFRLSTFASDAPNLNYAIAPLPSHKDKATYSSFWVNCLTKRATGPRLDASIKWLQYLTTPEVMRQWVEQVGELPARTSVAAEAKYANDPKLGPFLQSLDYGYATFFVDEASDRQAVLDAVNEVLLNNTPPDQAVKGAADKVQAMLDDYWKSVGA